LEQAVIAIEHLDMDQQVTTDNESEGA
jgi:hypothetical protein